MYTGSMSTFIFMEVKSPLSKSNRCDLPQYVKCQPADSNLKNMDSLFSSFKEKVLSFAFRFMPQLIEDSLNEGGLVSYQLAVGRGSSDGNTSSVKTFEIEQGQQFYENIDCLSRVTPEVIISLCLLEPISQDICVSFFYYSENKRVVGAISAPYITIHWVPALSVQTPYFPSFFQPF